MFLWFAGKHMCMECVSLLFSGCWSTQLIVLLRGERLSLMNLAVNNRVLF